MYNEGRGRDRVTRGNDGVMVHELFKVMAKPVLRDQRVSLLCVLLDGPWDARRSDIGITTCLMKSITILGVACRIKPNSELLLWPAVILRGGKLLYA